MMWGEWGEVREREMWSYELMPRSGIGTQGNSHTHTQTPLIVGSCWAPSSSPDFVHQSCSPAFPWTCGYADNLGGARVEAAEVVASGG